MKPCIQRLWLLKRNRQRGVAAVEFALIVIILFTLLLGIMEFGRLLFTWNTAVEATRRGARLAIVCDMNAAAIKTKMRTILPVISDADISVSYSPSSCSGASTCQSVTVEISPNAPSFNYLIPNWVDSNGNAQFDLIRDWGAGLNFNIPRFTTTLTRESLSSGTGADQNPDCL